MVKELELFMDDLLGDNNSSNTKQNENNQQSINSVPQDITFKNGHYGFEYLLEDDKNLDPKIYCKQFQLDKVTFRKDNPKNPIKIIGFVDCGTGCHQRSVIYDPKGLCRTIVATDQIETIRMLCPPREGCAQFQCNGQTYSVRHMTPLECWRMQGLKDEDFYKGLNEIKKPVKMIERAGRAICVPMLESIYKEYFNRYGVTNLRVFESFSGIGSQHLALNNLPHINCEYVGTSEVDKWGIMVYDSIHTKENGKDYTIGKTIEEMKQEMRDCNIAYNFSTYKDEMPKKDEEVKQLYNAHKRSHNFGDISKIDPKDLPDFDFFTYSFPCKNISVAGNMKGFEKGSGTQSSLVWECEKIIKEKKPKFLMMENVKNIIGKNNMDFFNEWIKLLESYGYENEWKLYNAWDYGVPQNRERVIMMSHLKED